MDKNTVTVRGVTLDLSELSNGYSAKEVFSNRECVGITFDDLILLPGAIDFGVHEVDLKTKLTKNITLNAPLCSTPMDTVTESEMAIAMALHGGIGFIHCNCTIADQVEMIHRVKSYENGFIMNPAVLSPTATIKELDELREEKAISGVPVTIDGKMGSKLVGLISNRDTDFLDNRNFTVGDLMVPVEQLFTGKYPLSIDEANKILMDSKKGYLPLVDEQGNLKSLTTRTDLKKQHAFPNSSKDKSGKLLVGASIRAGAKDFVDYDRVQSLYEAGCNVVVLDALNGDNDIQLKYIRLIKQDFPEMEVIAGNVVRSSQAKALLDAGADALRIGMGAGSVATSQLVKAVGRAQLSSVYCCALIARQYGASIIADGGIKNTGCLTKALSIGANAVMMGSLLAGIEECPGDYYYNGGIRLKAYVGNYHSDMDTAKGFNASSNPGSPRKDTGSPKRARSRSIDLKESANFGSTVTVAAGVKGAVVDKGPMANYFPYLCQSIRHGLQDIGTVSLTKLHEEVFGDKVRFELRSPSAQKEGGVHDLHSYTQMLYSAAS